MKNFGLIGAGGYIAPKHLQAIKETKNNLVAALDPNDSVGILDSYFPQAKFFTEYERFDRFIDKLRRSNSLTSIDFFSICSPNYLHDAHIRFSLRSGANVICEKPLVLNPWNLDSLQSLEKETSKKINTILQLRLHPSIKKLKSLINNKSKSKYEVDLTYIASRGNWYFQSWKGDENKSGGISTNIGIHFFDMLNYLFGKVQESFVHIKTPGKESGYLEYQNARVRWFLSIDENDLPQKIKTQNIKTYRSIKFDGEEIEFSSGFDSLHVESYQNILNSKGFGIDDSRVAIETISEIRSADIQLIGEKHPMISYLQKTI